MHSKNIFLIYFLCSTQILKFEKIKKGIVKKIQNYLDLKSRFSKKYEKKNIRLHAVRLQHQKFNSA